MSRPDLSPATLLLTEVRLCERDRALIVAGFAEVATTILRATLARDLTAEEAAQVRLDFAALILAAADRAAPREAGS